jgi:SAM-dependent methyltransferase
MPPPQKKNVERGAPLRFLENLYLGRYFGGRGIEIGALWRRFPVPSRARVWHLDRLCGAELEEHYPELRGFLLQPDLVADAMQLPFAPASLDFVIASHVLEHMPFPLAALKVWYDALAPEGSLLLKVPDMRYTFDAGRQRTPLARLVQEHRDPKRFDFRAHYADWSEKVGGLSPGTPELERDVDDLIERQYSIHFNVWTDDDIWEMIEFTRKEWGLKWRPAVFWRSRFYRKEITVVLRREC